ncbi:MAG: S1 RNA-binding domain-containing protein [Bacilli bacterium]|nr:S1 RNA-binding domain-containing protein [Bacilli bacterium]
MSKTVLPKVGDIASGTVVRVYSSYAILLFDEGWTGLLHISELSSKYIRSFTSYVAIGTIYNVKVTDVNEVTGSVRVSLKQMSISDKRKVFRHKKIDPEEIDFNALKEKLPEWIEQENEKENIHD